MNINTDIVKNKKSFEIQGTSNLKHFPDSTREWNNSIYVYNKNTLNLIPISSITATKIIKSYFSLINYSIEKRLRNRKLPRRFRRLSKNRIFIGNNEFKHTNNKVIVNIYLFNRQEKNLFIILKKRYNSWEKRNRFNRKKYDIKNEQWEKYNKLLKKRIKYFMAKISLLRKEHFINKYYLVRFNKYLSNNSLNKSLDILELFFVKFENRIKKSLLSKLELYFYYKQLIYVNRSKFNYSYLQYLKQYLYSVYNKNIEFNLINLKRFYLNSDILSESVRLKLAKNRRRIFTHLNKLRNKIKIKRKGVILPKSSIFNKISIQNDIIESIKYKNVTGFRLEAKGRLTKRHTASRSVSKFKYKGNLLNLDSSQRGLSTVLLKGNLESNLQFTKLKSKTNIGSFGLKGWISGN